VTWKPGQSGNPGGRSSAVAEVARLIREETRDCRELVEFALNVMRGLEDGMDEPAQRQYAHQWLSDRALGKPLQNVEMLHGPAEFTPEQQAMFEALRLSPHERRARILDIAAVAPAPRPDPDDAG
jgi:hypothetical protein